MDFSEVYKQTVNGSCCFSPNGKFLASILSFRVIVRDAETLEIINLFNFIDKIDKICWNGTSSLIACASLKLATIQVWEISSSETPWTCRIDEGIAGLTGMMFDPAGRNLITFSDFKLRVTVWDLVNKTAGYIQYPKYDDKGFSFRSDGKYFAIAERKDCKDSISIYDCEDWSMVKNFYPDTHDLDNIAWSPDGRYIAAWESSLEYKIYIYFPDGRFVASYIRDEPCLGIKSVRWSPSSQFLAVGSYDQKLRLLNNYTWKPSIEFAHPVSIDAVDINVFKEVDSESKKKMSKWEAAAEQLNIRYHVVRPPLNISTIKVDLDRANPKIGVGLFEFSKDARWVTSRNDNMPNCIWIFDLMRLCQTALVTQSSYSTVKLIKWNPVRAEIFVFLCSDGRKSTTTLSDVDHRPEAGPEGYVYLWNGRDVEAIQVPAVNFTVSNLEWNSDGTSLVLMDKDKYCVSYLIDE